MAPVRGDLSGRPLDDEVFVTAAPEVLANKERYNAREVLVNSGGERMLHFLEEQAALLRAEQEQAKLMRAELRGLVASHLDEMVMAQLKL